MKGYLANLVERTLGQTQFVQPRLHSGFEPTAPMQEPEEIGWAKSGAMERTESDVRPEPEAGDVTPTRTGVPPRPAEIVSRLDSNPELLPLQASKVAAAPLAFFDTEASARSPVPPAPPLAAEREPETAGLPESHLPGDSRSQNAIRPEPEITSRAKRSDQRAGTATLRPAGRSPQRSGSTHNQPQVVKVTIGRVEVRANFAPPTASPRPALAARPKLSLEDYLKSRNGGAR